MVKTGLLIDYNNIIKPNRLNLLVNKISPIPKFDNNHIGLILIVPNFQIDLLEKIPKGIGRVNYINTNTFVNNIEGHAWFIYNRRKKVCEIMGIYGSLTKYVLNSILSNIPNDVTIWIGIPIENQNILQLVENYTVFGFKNPYMCKISPLGYIFNTFGLCLLKNNNITDPSNVNEVIYVLTQFLEQEEKNCQMTLKFSPKTLKHLQQMSNIGSTLNKNNTISQKEIAGSFKLNKVVEEDSVFILEINKKSLIYGGEEEVNVVNSLYNFHTHPVEAYKRNGVKLGWPSSQDYIGFLASAIINGTIFHTVITIEGIYILSINNHWINRIYDNKFNKDSIKKFINKEYKIKREKGRDVNWYINKVNSISYNKEGFPIFHVQFFTWENASLTFTVSFKKKNTNCFAREKTLKKYNQIYSNKL